MYLWMNVSIQVYIQNLSNNINNTQINNINK